MWPVLCGRKWVHNLVGFGMLGLMFFGGLAAWWIRLHPAIQPLTIEFLPWFCGIALALKFGLTAAAVVALVHRGLVQPDTALKIIGAWFATALAVFSVVCCFFSPSWMAGVAVLVALPLDAIAFAPLALHWNRHR